MPAPEVADYCAAHWPDFAPPLTAGAYLARGHLLQKLLASRGADVSAKAPAFRDFRPGDVKHSLANIDKAAQLIGYAPTHTLEEGLDQALDWYLAALGRP